MTKHRFRGEGNAIVIESSVIDTHPRIRVTAGRYCVAGIPVCYVIDRLAAGEPLEIDREDIRAALRFGAAVVRGGPWHRT